jgi:uncharacterized protein (DUF697 family)/tellurite resistance protein
MNMEPITLSESEQKAVVLVCVMAAFSDGTQTENERGQIKRIVAGFSNDTLDLTTICQDALLGKVSLEQVVSSLVSPRSKTLAYEMAVCVCNADQSLTKDETEFLAKLRLALKLEADPAPILNQAATMSGQPLPPIIGSAPANDGEIDQMIVHYATLNGALELMPHSLATMASVPLQMRMVYRIGKHYGFELDRGHIKDFLATIGFGLTSHVVDGFLGKVIGGLSRHVGGRFIGGLASQATESGITFASTYALGQVAKRYYASGRTLTGSQLQDVFTSMTAQGSSLRGNYTNQILQQSRNLKASDLISLVRQA